MLHTGARPVRGLAALQSWSFSCQSCWLTACLFFQLQHRDSMEYRGAATQALLITAEPGLPQAEQHAPCVYLYIPACMHATAVHVWCSVHISALVSSYVSSMGVCPPPCLDVCTHLKGYNIQNTFIKVIQQAFTAAAAWVCVHVCVPSCTCLCLVSVPVWICPPQDWCVLFAPECVMMPLHHMLLSSAADGLTKRQGNSNYHE